MMLQATFLSFLGLFMMINSVCSKVYNIEDFGATGDGVTDDTNAVLRAISNCTANSGVLYIPTGKFVIRSSLIFKTNNPFTIRGDGWNSILLWEFNDHLIVITPEGGEIAEVTIRDLTVTSTAVAKSIDRFAIYAENLVRSQIEHLYIHSNDTKSYPVPGGIAMKGVADTNMINDVEIWVIKGTGIEIGHGSEIRITGGRIIGADVRVDDSIGIHCTGNNGGVHIVDTDIIALATGILLDNSSGAGSNREIFMSQATIDSNGQGLVVRDNSYISIVGIWAASSNMHQIFVDYNTSALISISGGTIFNGGAIECSDSSKWCNGMTVNSGSFILNGVEVRNNKGRGIWITNKSVTQFQIISCRIFANGQGWNINGSSFIVSNNICNANQSPNIIVDDKSSIVQNNLAC